MNHQKLICYQKALMVTKNLAKVMPTWGSGTAELRDQSKRASISLCLNIAEATGRQTPKERARFYVIARGSCAELMACLKIAQALELESPDFLNDHLTQVYKMLCALIKRSTS